MSVQHSPNAKRFDELASMLTEFLRNAYDYYLRDDDIDAINYRVTDDDDGTRKITIEVTMLPKP